MLTGTPSQMISIIDVAFHEYTLKASSSFPLPTPLSTLPGHGLALFVQFFEEYLLALSTPSLCCTNLCEAFAIFVVTARADNRWCSQTLT
jgi:hypothetical protein